MKNLLNTIYVCALGATLAMACSGDPDDDGDDRDGHTRVPDGESETIDGANVIGEIEGAAQDNNATGGTSTGDGDTSTGGESSTDVDDGTGGVTSTGGGDGTGGNPPTPSQDCTDYCNAWFDRECNAGMEVSPTSQRRARLHDRGVHHIGRNCFATIWTQVIPSF